MRRELLRVDLEGQRVKLPSALLSTIKPRVRAKKSSNFSAQGDEKWHLWGRRMLFTSKTPIVLNPLLVVTDILVLQAG